MIYAASPALDGLRYVVLDEVHYLQDRYRGAGVGGGDHPPARPRSTSCACRRRCRTPRRSRPGSRRCAARPRRSSRSAGRSTLVHLYLVGERGAEQLHLLPTFVAGPDGELRPNPEAARLDARNAPRPRLAAAGPAPGCTRPWRVEVVERLADGAMLPAIVFVFSRSGLRPGGRAVPRRRAAPHRRRRAGRASARSPTRTTAGLADDDLDVLGYDEWLAGLEAGFAAHHAGHGAADEGGGRGGASPRAW